MGLRKPLEINFLRSYYKPHEYAKLRTIDLYLVQELHRKLSLFPSNEIGRPQASPCDKNINLEFKKE